MHLSTKKCPLNDYLHSYDSSTVLSVVIKINSLCCTCQPDAVCVQQSLSSAALVVWVQCSRAGSKSVSTAAQHHERDTQDGTCSKYKGSGIEICLLVKKSYLPAHLKQAHHISTPVCSSHKARYWCKGRAWLCVTTPWRATMLGGV